MKKASSKEHIINKPVFLNNEFASGMVRTHKHTNTKNGCMYMHEFYSH